MNFVGVDLHKKVIQICVIRLEGNQRRVVCSRRFACRDVAAILAFFQGLRPFRVVVEATASYEWFVKLIEPLADEVVLAHPKKLRIIAESTHKTDKIDARILAEFLALDMVPKAYRPKPRQRQHRALVRYRHYVQKRTVSVRSKIRRILSNYNADCENLFSEAGLAYLETVEVSAADRFVLTQLVEEWKEHVRRLRAADKQLKAFAADEKNMPVAEREAREILDSFPTLGAVTIDIVLAELPDVKLFRSLKRAAAWVGLAPGIRESAGKAKQLHITKEGSRLVRWAMVQLAWRLVNKVSYWRTIFERLARRCGKKKAIVAVARRAFCTIVSMLKSGQKYRFGGPAEVSGQQSGLGLTREGPKVEKRKRAAAGRDAVRCGDVVQAAGRGQGRKRREADPGSASAPPLGPAPALGSHPCVALSSGQAIANRAHKRGQVKRTAK